MDCYIWKKSGVIDIPRSARLPTLAIKKQPLRAVFLILYKNIACKWGGPLPGKLKIYCCGAVETKCPII